MITLSELAKLLGCELHYASAEPLLDGKHDGDQGVAAVASIGTAAPDTLVFADDPAAFAAAAASPAAAILVSRQTAAASVMPPKPMLFCAQPRLAFARAAKLLAGSREASAHQTSPASQTPPISQTPTIHPTAVVAESAHLAAGVIVGPHAVLDEQVRIGAGSIVDAGAVVGKGVSIGADCRIYSRVVLYPGTTLGDRVVVHAGAVLGCDGFGYVRDQATGEYVQFPQQGRLIIEDDVEIGANSTVDRGALEETRIARGAKIDNLVHIGHNVRIGRNAVIAAQTGISGSSVIGNDAILGGQVGIGDHAGVGDGVILGGQAGILPHKHLHGPGLLFWGTPAQPVKRHLRQLATLARLAHRRNAQQESGQDAGLGTGKDE
jgi:UDP-3-O-[3-hydroxymyristoyl] glucosamine N-acyltransferase